MDAAVQVNNNVKITVMDGNGRTLRSSNLHNKATMHMVTGLLEFLGGYFNPVATNNNSGYTSPEEISSYVPVHLHLGTVGIKMTDRSTDKPKLIELPLLFSCN